MRTISSKAPYAFVGNPLDMQCSLPHTIADGLVLARPNNSQRRAIKKYLADLGGRSDNTSPFECSFAEKPLASPRADVAMLVIETKRLKSSEWRYYVVLVTKGIFNTERGCQEIEALRAASHLTEHSLHLNPTHFRRSWWSEFTSDWEFFTHMAVDGGHIVACTPAYVEDLRHCYAAMQRLRSSHLDLIRSLQMYNDLPDRVGYNELTTLGLFSVLESLLTHNPRGEHDSISHQIRKKIALVEKRLSKPIDYSCFQQAASEALWTKLYEFRSKIAHGGGTDFDKSLSLLRDAYTVEVFMKRTLRALLRGAIEEPDLYVDLRAV